LPPASSPQELEPAPTSPDDVAGRLAAIERRLEGIERLTADVAELVDRAQETFDQLGPTIDQLRPILDGLMRGKFGRMVRVLSASDENTGR
jgi:hypothetical protein